MEEVIFRGVTPDGRTVVQVSAIEDLFIGRVILDESHVLTEIKTTDSDRLLSWSRKQITEAMRRTTRS